MRREFEKTAETLSGKDVLLRFRAPIESSARGTIFRSKSGYLVMDISPTLTWDGKFQNLLHESAHAKYHLKGAAKFDLLDFPSGSFERSAEDWQKYEVDPEEEEARNQAAEWLDLVDELVPQADWLSDKQIVLAKCVALRLYYEIQEHK